MSNWDAVKGFFRRQTQKFKESSNRVQHHTVDPKVDKAVGLTFHLRRSAGSMLVHIEALSTLLSEVVDVMQKIDKDLADAGEIEEFSIVGRRFQVMSAELQPRAAAMRTELAKEIPLLRRFHDESMQLENILEDRRDKMLEMDFFRNKVAALRADPPSDTSRIPRNEGRVEEFRRLYDAATQRVLGLCDQLNANGAKYVMQSASVAARETGLFFDEAGRKARSFLLLQDSSQQVASAMAHAMASRNPLPPQGQVYAPSSGSVPSSTTGPAASAAPPSHRQVTADLVKEPVASPVPSGTIPNQPPTGGPVYSDRTLKRFQGDETDNPFRV